MSNPTLPAYKVLASYAAWWLLWMVIQAYLLHQLGVGFADAAKDAAVTQLIVAMAGYTINTSMHSYQPSSKNLVYVLTWSIALAALCVLFQQWLVMRWIANPPAYRDLMDRSLLIRGLFAWLMIVIVAMLTWLWVYVNEQSESERRKEDALRLAREAELSNLRMQMQPHFLFNSLNSISALIGPHPQQARLMIQQLSDFLRGTIKREERQLVSLAEELKHLQFYLEIEKVRFGHRLRTVVEHDEESLKMKIPSLLLQPILENAIKFGLYDTLGEITITLSARSEQSRLNLEVRNPFDPETAQPRKGTGFGLAAVQRRLYLIYSQRDLLETHKEENTFITSLTIPQG